MKIHELMGWLLVACSWGGMYAIVLDILSRLGLGHFPSVLANPLGSWLTFIVWLATFYVNIRFVLYVMGASKRTPRRGAK